MHGHELALQVRGQLGHLKPAFAQDALHLVAVGLALGCLGEVEQALIPAWNLDALEAESRGPAGDGLQIVERRRIARELRQEYGRPLDRPHRASSGEGGRKYAKSVIDVSLVTLDDPSNVLP